MGDTESPLARLAAWPLFRQVRDRDVRGLGRTARSRHMDMIAARVIETRRQPWQDRDSQGRLLNVGSRLVHQVGLPFHWGSRGLTRGDSANDLRLVVLDPDVDIQESKAATCDIHPGRRGL
jgi:hypothetical protein